MANQVQNVTFRLRPEDFKAWWVFQSWRPRANRLSLWFGALAIAFVCLVAGNRYALGLERTLVLGLVGAVAGYFLVRHLMTAGVVAFAAAQFKSAAGQTQLGTYSLTIGPDGIAEQAPNGSHEHAWAAVEDLSETSTHFFFIVAGSQAYIVPKRAFSSPTDERDFWARATLFWDAAAAPRDAAEQLDAADEARASPAVGRGPRS